MAAIVGTGGSVTAAGNNQHVLQVRRWSGTISEPSVDTTEWDAAATATNYRSTIGSGIAVFTGTIEGLMDTAQLFVVTEYEDTTPVLTNSFVLVQSDTGGTTEKVTYTFSGLQTGWNTGAAIAEVVTYTMTFISTGAVTITKT